MKTMLQLVAKYNIQLHISDLYYGHHQVVQITYCVVNKFFGQPDDDLHTGPKHVVV